jgi:catechol 2,3-dioxygenase-like lactoylglutathione lyase family enzyme
MLEIRDLHHVSLVVKDVAVSVRFYGDVLKMVEVPRPRNFTFGGAWMRKGGAEIHFIQADEAVQPPGDAANHPTERHDVTFARHFCLEINDVEAMLASLKEHNIPILMGPRQRGDGAVQTYCYDPDGHMIELVYVPPELAAQYREP